MVTSKKASCNVIVTSEFSETDTCTIFGVSPQSLRGWIKRKPELRKQVDGRWKYNTADIHKWRVQRERDVCEEQSGTKDILDMQDKLLQAREKFNKEKARSEKRKNDV